MRIFQNVIQAMGIKVLQSKYDDIIDVLLKSAEHINRFVREITYFVIEALYEVSDQEEASRPLFEALCSKLLPITANGLADNWSQVRFAASRATRAYYKFGKTNESLRAEWDTLMLPRMCLNRYYVAEGVRNYSIETWKQVVDDKGIVLVS